MLHETLTAWRDLPLAIRSRVHVAEIPIDDPEEAAVIVNALQTRASVILQKSRGEGFGMTVLEGMWKERPVVCTRVGGLQEQVIDGVTGFLFEPGDNAAAGAAICRLLYDKELAQRMGTAGHERVREHFLLPQGARSWGAVIDAILGDRHTPRLPSAEEAERTLAGLRPRSRPVGVVVEPAEVAAEALCVLASAR